jgi:hypothetical protein
MKDPEKESRSKSNREKASAGVGLRTVQVRHENIPPKITRPKRIHPRRLLPFVAEGRERGVHSLSPRAFIALRADVAPDVRVALNTPLTQPAQNRTSSNVNEPSVSAVDDVVFYTGNWYASISTDGGQTFQFIDPTSVQQPDDPQGLTFCCDQVVNYMPTLDTFVWLMQYSSTTGGDNIQRLALATSESIKSGNWRLFDITTQMLGVPGFFLDFPDLAVSSSHLYMTTNCFGPDNVTVGSAVVRIALDSISSGNLRVEKFVSMDLFSFRVAQNCGDIAYFAAHKDTSTLSVFSWPKGDAAPTSRDVGVARWIGTNGYISRTPDGRRWLDRADPRITGATLAGNELWFAWGVDADSNHRAKPFAQMARIKADDMSVIEDVNLFDTDSAICYAGLSTNSNGEVGVSYMIGGAVFPSHVVGFMSGSRDSLVAGRGDRSPVPDSHGHFDWGDYLTVRPVFRRKDPNDPNSPKVPTSLFAATGYSFLGNQDGADVDATPRLVVFGRSANVGGGGPSPGDGPGSGGSTAPGGGAGPEENDGSGPIADVNTLPTVSHAVAAQIKAACGVHRGIRAFAVPPPTPMPALVTKPGKERWPVKTGQDPDRDAVGKNVVNGRHLGAGIVPATVEELISMPRPAGMEDANADPPEFQEKRANLVEVTIWRIEGNIIVLNQEKDGDRHLVIQGASGATLVAEVPTATKRFIGDSPWMKNIKAARQAVDDKLVHNLSPRDFILPPGGDKLVPLNSVFGDLPLPTMASFKMPESFRTPAEAEEGPIPTFQTAVKPTPVRITGIGFFDREHGATGAAPNVFEIHPVLKIEFL